MKRIKHLPPSLRPREKLLKYGPPVLTLEELVCVLLVTGNRSLPLSQLAPKIAQLVKNENVNHDNLIKLGIGTSKAAQILAAQELGKRLLAQPAITITSPEQIFAHCHEIIDAQKESLLCFYLNARGELLKKELVAVGFLTNVDLLPREIFSLIKQLPVASIILAHNHPSGTLKPSEADLHFTYRVKLASDILGVKLLDHFIVSKEGWIRINLSQKNRKSETI